MTGFCAGVSHFSLHWSLCSSAVPGVWTFLRVTLEFMYLPGLQWMLGAAIRLCLICTWCWVNGALWLDAITVVFSVRCPSLAVPGLRSFHRVTHVAETIKARNSSMVLHGESCERLALQRNTTITHIQSNQMTRNRHISDQTPGRHQNSSLRVKSHNTNQHSNPARLQHSCPHPSSNRPRRVIARVLRPLAQTPRVRTEFHVQIPSLDNTHTAGPGHSVFIPRDFCAGV